MIDRPRILLLVSCPEPLKGSYARLIKRLGRQYGIRVVDHRLTTVKRLADLAELVKFAKDGKSEITPDREQP